MFTGFTRPQKVWQKQPRPMESPQQARFLTTARWFSALRPLTATSTLRRKSPGPKHRGMKYGEGDHGAVCHVPGFTFFQTSSIYRRRGSRFFLLPTRLPCPQLQKARHVHAVDLVHAPAALQQRVVRGIDKFIQRQAGFASVCGVAAFVGKSLRMPVVCVCTAMSASATSCISRSTG